jgi:DNA-binding transcriptional LysR family regulator
MSFGLRHVAPALPEFLALYPEVSVDLQLDDRMVDLIAGGVDVAVRIADLPDSSLLARRLCQVRRWIVGAPHYFERHGRPSRPRDLADHACLAYSYQISGETWRFSKGGEDEAITVPAKLSANNGDALTAALEAGQGVALLPDFIVWDALGDGRLIKVLEDWQSPPLSLNIVTPGGGPRAPRTQVLVEFLTRRFSTGAAPWTR